MPKLLPRFECNCIFHNSGAPKKRGGDQNNNYENPGTDIGDGYDEDEENHGAYNQSHDEAFSRASEDPKHPLRIDMRNNNPSKEAIEALLESAEYKSTVSKLLPLHNF